MVKMLQSFPYFLLFFISIPSVLSQRELLDGSDFVPVVSPVRDDDDTPYMITPPHIPYKCGAPSTRVSARILGSTISKPHNWPWMALLGKSQLLSVAGHVEQKMSWFCGGSLINTQWVISAAHCLDGTEFVVRLGEHDYDDDIDDGVDYKVMESIYHPSYNPAFKYYDIVLLKIGPVEITELIRPICLPWQDSTLAERLEGQAGIISGWGATGFGLRQKGSNVLLETTVHVENTKRCEDQYSKFNLPRFQREWPQGITDRTVLCAGSKNGSGSCQGDSGGPLMMKDTTGTRYVLMGIVSNAIGCGHSEFPGLYIPVIQELLWIRRMAFGTTCNSDYDCGPLDICFSQSCTSPCSNRCGKGARCYLVKRQALCSCPEGFSGNPYSRCWPHEFFDELESDVNGITTRPTREKLGDSSLLPKPEVCTSLGNKLNNKRGKILGGSPVAEGSMPWIAIILVKTKDKQIQQMTCSGSLINPRYVLTVAHCMDKTSQLGLDLSTTRVRLGTNYLDETEKNFIETGFEKLIPHENYDKVVEKGHDIGLIRLDTSLEFWISNGEVTPICLAPRGFNIRSWSNGEDLFSAGWGFTENQHLKSNVLLAVRLSMADDADCSKRYAEIFSPKRQLCVGGNGKDDTCGGDSGGPLMYLSSSEKLFIQVGITSFGSSPCGTVGWPGVYTDVVRYLDWIYEHLEP